MSFHWREIEQSQNIPITSIRCLMAALDRIDANLTQVPRSHLTLIKAEKRFFDAQNASDKLGANSLEETNKLADLLQKEIDANNSLQEAINKAESDLPQKISITSSEGRKFVLNQKAGAYRLTWSEEIHQHSEDGSINRRREDPAARNFAKSLSNEYRISQSNNLDELKNYKKRMLDFGRDASERMEQAMRIRTHWERIEEARRLKVLRGERKDHVVNKARKLGYKTEVKEVGNEIIISGTHRSLDTGNKKRTKNSLFSRRR